MRLTKGVYYIVINKQSYGNYSNSDYTLTLDTEKPAAVSKMTLKNSSSSKLTISYSKVNSSIGYQIAYCTSKSFSSSSTKYITSAKNKITLSKLAKGKTYYVKVRAYKYNSNGQKCYGSWSSVKSIKISK